MIRINQIVISLVLLALILSGCKPVEAPAGVAPATLPAGKVELGITADQITSAALAGNLLGDPATRPFNVILPPGYAAGEIRYPVVYVLHAYEGDEGTQAWNVKQDMEKMLAAGAVRNMILVFPDASNALRGSMYLSSPTIGDYETYLAQDLVDYVDSNYRTLPQPASRGITGCWHGGDGALHLALRHPDIFSVVAPYSAIYDWAKDPMLAAGAMSFRREPQSLAEFTPMEPSTRTWIAYAAGAASNPDKPPFYLDMPFAMAGKKGEVVPEVVAKIVAADPVHDLARYLGQPERLRAILLYHGMNDFYAPATQARAYDELLAAKGIAHEFVEVKRGCCIESPDYTPVLEFMSDNLAFEEPAQ
jgi:hypothetical protein